MASLFFCAAWDNVAAKRALDRDQRLALLHQELEVARRSASILPTGFPASEHFTVGGPRLLRR